MRVILKEYIENLGSKGDIVDVASGYGRNHLVPKKLALEVTFSNMKMIEIERQALLKKVEKERMSYQELIEKLNQVSLSFKRKTGEKDIIFGSVSSSDIKEALQELGLEIDKKKILLEEPLKRLGNYTVPIKVYQEDRAEIKVGVIKEEEVKPKERMEEKEKTPKGEQEEAKAEHAEKEEKEEVKERSQEEREEEEEKEKIDKE